MKRREVMEFEDQPWFPGWLRDCMTRMIVVASRAFGVHRVVPGLIKRVVAEQGISQVVDLGSGGGGVMPYVLEELRKDPDTAQVSITLTDKFPNRDAIARFGSEGQLRYQAAPVDATDLAQAPEGLKTMVNCFHHMSPEQARAILKSARDSRQPLLIYEMGDPMPFPLWLAGLVVGLPLVYLSCLLMTPWARPLTLKQLVFTYLFPIIPACYAWDGQASVIRTYSLEDLDELLEGLHGEGYRWEKGKAPNRAKQGSYLLGLPT